VNVVVSYMPLSDRAILREEVKMLAANDKVTSINVWLMQESDTGAFKDKDGKSYEIVPVELKDVLKKPAKKP